MPHSSSFMLQGIELWVFIYLIKELLSLSIGASAFLLLLLK